MPSATLAAPPAQPLLAIDAQKALFSLSSFIAAAATLGIAFTASLPRPWWALLTVYVTAQPMAGAFRPKALYRIGGILIGAAFTLWLVPNLQNSPELLVLCMASWTGFCIYLAVLDRTPRAFLFQMAAFSSAVMTFPYLDDPANIFTTTISRIEEMVVAIVCVTATHALLQPWSATPVIRGRAQSFLGHAARWTAEALGTRHTPLEQEHRRELAADVTELGMIAVHLPFDQRGARATQRAVLALQEQLGGILPLASAAANRLDLLRRLGPLDAELETLTKDVGAWLRASPDSADFAHLELIARCSTLAVQFEGQADWAGLLAVSACDRIAGFIAAHHAARQLARHFEREQAPDLPRIFEASPDRQRFALARDHSIALLAGLATATAICLYCAVWIDLAWTSGSATAAFAALITCSFAMQDDPAPVIGRYLMATLATFPLAALYLFVLLPRVDGYQMLVITLAPALLWMGYIQADPARSPRALPMFSCFIVAMGFLDRFQPDFAAFINTGIAQLGGIIATLAVTKLFRSANAMWTTRRIVRDNWADIERLADIRRPFEATRWTMLATDRLGQVAARMAMAGLGDNLHAADGLADLRIGRNTVAIRRALAAVPYAARHHLGDVLSGVRILFGERRRTGAVTIPPATLCDTIDGAIRSLLATSEVTARHDALLGLVGMRCNLFPEAPPIEGELA